MNYCNVENCDREIKSKGLCGRHYQSLWKFGDPLHVDKNGRSKEIKNKPLPYEETHKIINNIEYKLCRLCCKWHPMNEDYFYKKKGKDGFDSYCKNCSRKKYKEYRDNNSEIYIKRTYEHYQKNKESYDQRRTKWMRKNKDFVREYKKEWLQLNIEYMAQYQADRRERKTHDISDEEWDNCLNYFNYSCAYCGIPQEIHKEITNQVLHKEHYDHEGSNDLSNAVPACRRCNSSKWAHKIEVWYPKQNYYSLERFELITEWLNKDYKLYIETETNI